MNLARPMFKRLYDKERHSMELVSMLFTLFYFFPLYFHEALTLGFVLKALLMYALLMLNLVLCALLKDRQKIVAAYCLVVFATAGASFYMGTNVFFGYAVFYLTIQQRIQWAIVSLLFVLGCVFFSAYSFDLLKPYFILPTLIPSTVLFISGIFERSHRKHKKREAQSSEQLERLAQVAERERIARDLHDVLGHTLSSIALKSQLAEKLINANDTEAAKKEIREVAEITSATLSEVRQAISGIKSMTIDERVIQLQDRLGEKGLDTTLSCDFSPLKPKAEAAVALLLTEAVTNILRHSTASEVSVKTQVKHDDFHLSICDNGKVDTILAGNGLNGIKDRVEDLGGRFQLSTEAGVCLSIALPKENLQ